LSKLLSILEFTLFCVAKCLKIPFCAALLRLHLRSFMPNSSRHHLDSLSLGDRSAVIQMAWEDRTAFETIQARMGLAEPEVIRLMRAELTPRSFKMWRTRMRGRVTKHRALRNPDMKFDDHAVADHRRANC